MPTARGDISFLQQSDTRYKSHTPGNVPCSEEIANTEETPGIFCFLVVLFFGVCEYVYYYGHLGISCVCRFFVVVVVAWLFIYLFTEKNNIKLGREGTREDLEVAG